MKEIFYAGIGSRDTPPEVLSLMESAARFLGRKNLVLRSGGARGADRAFETGCDSISAKKEIYLPTRGFGGHPSLLYGTTKEARQIASKFHPCWANVSHLGRDFHARNLYQLLGNDLQNQKPSLFVLCYTPNGKVVGGTGQALRMAEHYQIPVFNFGNMDLDSINAGILGLLKNI